MYTIREIRIFVRCAVAQLLAGNESLAHGPIRAGTLDARPRTALGFNGARVRSFFWFAVYDLARR